jgi:peptide/nickel transport system substrate-binding protein
LVALLGLLAMVAAACSSNNGGGNGGGGSGSAASNAQITIALGSEPTTLDPQLRDDGNERAVTVNIYETLLTRSAQGDLQPLLATDLPTQVDATTWEFKLQSGVTFTDGEPFNADAVVSSVERVIDPKFASEQSGWYTGITGAKKVDDTTVDITTESPDPALPARMAVMRMVPPQASQNADFADKPVGTGPYELAEWTKGDHVTLDRNPDYWGDEPQIAQVTYNFAEDSGARLSGLLSGQYDLITNLSPDDIGTAPNSASVLGQEHPVMILNARDGVTADVRVRQALNYAIDKDTMVQSLLGGKAEVDACQILSPSIPGFNSSLQAYPYDPTQAKQLLQEAGAEGATINLVGESGRWLKDREIIEAVANYWDAVGLKVNVQIFTFDEYLNRLFDQKNRPDAIFVSSSNDLLDADRQLSTYYSMDGIGSSNSDKKLKSLIDQARQETDTTKREQLYNEAVKIGCDNAYFAFLFNNDDIYGLSARLQFQPRVDAYLPVKEMTVTG